MTPSMFGDDNRKPEKKPRAKPKPNQLSPWFDAFVSLLGPVAVRAAAGRLGQLAKRMEAEGLAPADLAAGAITLHAVSDADAVESAKSLILRRLQLELREVERAFAEGTPEEIT